MAWLPNVLKQSVALACAALLVFIPVEAAAFSRVKDLVDFEGVRDNMLVGYGLVVGLNGTGDSLTQRALHPIEPDRHAGTARHQFQRPDDADQKCCRRDGNGQLPAFAAQGTRIDVTVTRWATPRASRAARCW